MSAGYAERLKEYPNKGRCGLPEILDSTRVLSTKIKKLVSFIQSSANIVILTGAGISTASGIPDFRGPMGIWTLEKKKKKQRKQLQRRNTTGCEDNNSNENQNKNRKRSRSNSLDNLTKADDTNAPLSLDFALAKPSLTHQAIMFLVRKQLVQMVITQNVDGLHQRSGLSRDNLCVLHGCAFTEKCATCCTEHYRDYDVGGMSFQKTGRQCEVCGGDLIDTLLDWEDPLPELDFKRATDACKAADLVISLGTSLRIEPAASLPTFAKKFVIVNLQETPYDAHAALLIRGKVDDVIQVVMKELGYSGWESNDCLSVNQVERLWKYSNEQQT